MGSTSIEWTDRTWNPVTGCTKVSPGCAHCYAETIAKRLWSTSYSPVACEVGDPREAVRDAARVHLLGNSGQPGLRFREFTDVRTHEDRLLAPLSWRKPARIFVNSMSDLFHEDVPDPFILGVMDVIRQCPRHTFQVLTKRPARMRDLMSRLRFDYTGDGRMWLADAVALDRDRQPISFARLLKNLWLGVSVENQHFADERIPLLLRTPAAVRFISAEPLLGGIDVARFLDCGWGCRDNAAEKHTLDWVIVGGESGPQARACDVAWVRSIVQQCRAAGVAVFAKQLGARPYVDEDLGGGRYREARDRSGYELALKDRKGGDPVEWPEDLRVREFPPPAPVEALA
ncbi:MAG: hypothetical protein A3J29_07965 [Acidobacteria bacterium RIFCSPLOWO2_12_FULL_67_14b]|nr:MAG: hypothetical protein A3J29_07965 [Acidobacteria bacterium RIFCSPLOWO2_12_FULL_67_14b]